MGIAHRYSAAFYVIGVIRPDCAVGHEIRYLRDLSRPTDLEVVCDPAANAANPHSLACDGKHGARTRMNAPLANRAGFRLRFAQDPVTSRGHTGEEESAQEHGHCFRFLAHGILPPSVLHSTHGVLQAALGIDQEIPRGNDGFARLKAGKNNDFVREPWPELNLAG